MIKIISFFLLVSPFFWSIRAPEASVWSDGNPFQITDPGWIELEEKLQCFTPGACSQSYHIDGDSQVDKMACLQYCKSRETCAWFTYYTDFKYCQLFANCSAFEVELCPTCVSGQAACEPPVCWRAAQCVGNVYHLERVSNNNDCLNLCKNKTGCNWFTFHSPSSACLLYKTCPKLDDTCKTCVTGQTECETQPTTTTTIATSTTAATTTTITTTTTTTSSTTMTAMTPTASTTREIQTSSEALSTTTTAAAKTTSRTTTTKAKPEDQIGPIYIDDFYSQQGEVAFVVGGFCEVAPDNLVEIFSPDGECQHQLAPLPVPQLINPVLVLLDGQIVICGEYYDFNVKGFCWFYNSVFDSWSHFTTRRPHTLNKQFVEQPGNVYGDKLYVLHDMHTEVFDPETMTWRTWPRPPPISPDQVYRGACMLAYEDSFIVMGGLSKKSEVLQFNHTTQDWNRLATSPMQILNSGCTVLPNAKILVLGFFHNAYQKTAAIFDIKQNRWQSLGDTNYLRLGTSLVRLGSRVFALDGGGPLTEVVEEYHYNNNTWSTTTAQLQFHRRLHSSISVPAQMFEHLPGGCKGVV